MDKKEMAMVSAFAYEGMKTTMERIIRKLVVTLAVSVILLFTSNLVWLYVWVTDVDPHRPQAQMLEVKASNEGIQQERKKSAVVVSYTKKAKLDYGSMSRSEIEELIDEWIFNERNRAIMKRRLLDGICLEPLAEEFDLSVSQIKNIIRKCQDRLFR